VASVFTRIIRGELPAHFVWKDERCVCFLSTAPLKPGHTLVVPRDEVDHWLDLEPDLMKHVTGVAQTVGRAIQAEWNPVKVGTLILGLEVPHVHVHVTPIWTPTDMDFANANGNATPEEIAAAAQQLRGRLTSMGCAEVSDSP
jgi:diadenosine tetraphosphate (Ap4A) HIT family hydrolase